MDKYLRLLPDERVRKFLKSNRHAAWINKGFWRPGEKPSARRKALPVPTVDEINISIESMRLNHGSISERDIERTKRGIIGICFISSPEIIDEVYKISPGTGSIAEKYEELQNYVRFPKNCVPVASTSLGGLLIVESRGLNNGVVYLYDDESWEEDVRNDSIVCRHIESMTDLLVDPAPIIHAKLLDEYRAALRMHGLSDVVKVRVVGK